MNITTQLENSSVATVATAAESNIEVKPLSAYVVSKLNVRKKKGTTIGELAALSHAQGLLQNLIGYEQKRKGKPTGKIEVVGGRRLEALQLLQAEQGDELGRTCRRLARNRQQAATQHATCTFQTH